MDEIEPTPEELAAWLEEEKKKDRARWAAHEERQKAEAMAKRAELAKPVPPRWFRELEQKLGERIRRIQFMDGGTVDLRPTRARSHNWRLAAQLIVEGKSLHDVADELNVSVKEVRRKFARGSRLRAHVADLLAERRRVRDMRLEVDGQRLLSHIYSPDIPDGDRDKGLMRWMAQHVTRAAPAVPPAPRRSRPALAANPAEYVPDRAELVPNRAGIIPDRTGIAPDRIELAPPVVRKPRESAVSAGHLGRTGTGKADSEGI